MEIMEKLQEILDEMMEEIEDENVAVGGDILSGAVTREQVRASVKLSLAVLGQADVSEEIIDLLVNYHMDLCTAQYKLAVAEETLKVFEDSLAVIASLGDSIVAVTDDLLEVEEE